MRWISLALLSLAALALLLWWNQRDGTPGEAAEAEPQPAEALSNKESQETALFSADAPVAGVPEVEGAETSAQERRPLDEPSQNREHAGGKTLDVLVLDPAGAPVPRAPVSFLDLATLYEEEPDLLLQGMDLDAAFLHSRIFLADEQGIARVPWSPAGGYMMAERDGLFGFTLFDHDSTRIERLDLQLGPDLGLDVRVVDVSGAPVSGVPVALRTRGDGRVNDVFCATTGSEGLAELNHLQLVLDEEHIEDGTCVGLALLLAEPVEAQLATGQLPSHPIELVLPPTGSVEIRLEDSARELVSESALIELEIAREAPRDEHEEWERRYLNRSRDDRMIQRVGSGGRLVVDRIGLGLDLEVRVKPFARWRPVESLERGPKLVGELAVVRVPVFAALSTLTGRLVRPDGVPFGEAEVSTDLWVEPEEGGRRGWSPPLKTDVDGRFTLELDGDWPTSGRFAFALWTDASDGQRWWRREEWQTQLVAGSNDLSDLVLEPLPIVAAGRITDEDGRPIEARAVLAAPEVDPDGWKTSGWKKGDQTAADGMFSIQVKVETREVVLAVHAEGYVSRNITLPTGATDVSIALARGGGIEGGLLVADERALESLAVTVRNAATGVNSHINEIPSDGRFAFSDLAPGLYEVLIEVHAEPESALSVSDVIVQAGEVARDPRLQPIDLREQVRTFAIAFEGNEEDWLDLFVRRKATGASEFSPEGEWLHEYRELVLSTGHPALDLRITPRDGRTEELTGVCEDRTLLLRPGLPVVVRLVPPIALSEHEWLELSLESRTGTPLSEFWEPRFWDGEHAEVFVPEPGTYAVHVNFLLQVPGDLATFPLPIVPEVVLDVRETDEPQVFDLVLSPGAREEIENARR